MTEPTLTELREIARRTVTRRHHESEEGMLANAFLALTDPEPLTDEHCREAGMQATGKVYFGRFASRNLRTFTIVDPSDQLQSCIESRDPTRGQLLLALSLEAK